MNRRKKYRLFIVCFLALDLLAIVLLGYQYLSRKIPDEIQVSGENEADVAETIRQIEALFYLGKVGRRLQRTHFFFAPVQNGILRRNR